MTKPTYRWDLEEHVIGCCGIYSLYRMTYSSIKDYSVFECVSSKDITNIIRESIRSEEELNRNVGGFNGDVTVMATASSKETPAKWQQYLAKNWEEVFSFVNTKSGNTCTVYKMTFSFTTEDFTGNNDDDDDYEF
jgi:hypothetical protein